jgi:Fe-S-cluster containining protein
MMKECARCGTCCRNGGPPLHIQDLHLIRTGVLAFDDLVTVRRGELVLPPMADIPVPAETEWIKIQGSGGKWSCRFLDPSSGVCTLYAHRPSSCRVLKCWDTSEILAMAGRDLLARADVIAGNDPLLALVQQQEEWCPVPDMGLIAAMLAGRKGRVPLLKDLTLLVERDLHIRTRAVREFNISVAGELFYFGRPLFQLFIPMDIVTTETAAGLQLHFRPGG